MPTDIRHICVIALLNGENSGRHDADSSLSAAFSARGYDTHTEEHGTVNIRFSKKANSSNFLEHATDEDWSSTGS